MCGPGGAAAVAVPKAPEDGGSLLLVLSSTKCTVRVGRAVRAELTRSHREVGDPCRQRGQLQYDLLHDGAPVALLSSNPYLVVTRNGLPAQTLQDVIAIPEG
jgi:hypothetical protein